MALKLTCFQLQWLVPRHQREDWILWIDYFIPAPSISVTRRQSGHVFTEQMCFTESCPVWPSAPLTTMHSFLPLTSCPHPHSLPHAPPAPLTAPHGLQRCLRLVMELKLSPQLLQPCFSLSRLVLEDPLFGPGCRDEGCG